MNCSCAVNCLLRLLKLSRNSLTKITTPKHSAIGNIHTVGIFCYWVLLHYNMSLKTIAGGFNGAFWWYGPLSEDREQFKQIYRNYLVALKRLCMCLTYFVVHYNEAHESRGAGGTAAPAENFQGVHNTPVKNHPRGRCLFSRSVCIQIEQRSALWQKTIWSTGQGCLVSNWYSYCRVLTQLKFNIVIILSFYCIQIKYTKYIYTCHCIARTCCNDWILNVQWGLPG